MVFDAIVIGAGIVGLSTARHLLKSRSDLKLLILEKEERHAFHQTGRNSGVIHSGVYYLPGSEKAKHCYAGRKLLEDFCDEHGIAWKRSGKLIVATQQKQLPQLRELERRANENGVASRWLAAEEVNDFEPHVASVAALSIPEAGVVNYQEVCDALVKDLKNRGAELRFGVRVDSCVENSEGLELKSVGEAFATRLMVNCAGLYSDRVARMFNVKLESQIIPFRGEYFALKPEFNSLCKTLIYPVPNPDFPFLGVHLTRGVDSRVTCGPNAVLAFSREGYKRTDVSFRDLMETMAYPGFWKLALGNMGYGLHELWRSFSKASFVRSLQTLVPEVQAHMLEPYPAGVRAQVVYESGKLADDFIVKRSAHAVHVINAPSPAATASLALGETIGNKALEQI
ncbi:MAG: L-2-hydroxyglutarate oxidase [Deltaproteobacteria bacterium]|jgi:(S)-2-hydroxyglutarate dehydrogenase|nr:L-2-hydroxyglutarate oxidase [Deltaproteobacteria bacterium]MBT6432257.1 L-2-hydroxyglutarate oxidase [Deltaproteobacteria bacterium]MBT6488288.1 L-2-hydroxyglutarate oxidase [Deltaproteobacteria bacterium]